jgi:hypothetical protein
MDWKYKTLHDKLNRLEQNQNKLTQPGNLDFHPRIVNHTDIQFCPDEFKLLNKGLKYNLHHKKKNWIKELALEAETAVTYLPTTEQDYIRSIVTHNIEQLYKQELPHPQSTNRNAHHQQYQNQTTREQSHYTLC